MIPAVKIKNLVVEKAELTVLKALTYFDIFNYPLTGQEIKNFLGHSINEEEFRSALRQLLFAKTIFKFNEFYSLHNDPEMVEKRLQGNARAKRFLPKAAKIGAFLYKFPYVRAVAVSGSLSKNYADPKADIDFFIITKTNRLWIARTFLHLFKKCTFLIGHQHFYCMNYFIDEKALLIRDQNIYSATEVVTLLPVGGADMINLFFRINSWTADWLPVYEAKHELNISDKDSFLKKIVEKIFDKKAGDRFDDFLFRLTTRRWQRKEKLGRRNLKGKLMNLVTGKHFSKSDPGAFQEKIIAMYKNKIDQLKDSWPRYFG